MGAVAVYLAHFESQMSNQETSHVPFLFCVCVCFTTITFNWPPKFLQQLLPANIKHFGMPPAPPTTPTSQASDDLLMLRCFFQGLPHLLVTHNQGVRLAVLSSMLVEGTKKKTVLQMNQIQFDWSKSSCNFLDHLHGMERFKIPSSLSS